MRKILIVILMLLSSMSYALDRTLSWTAPTLDAEGNALTDLSGYYIYYGTATDNLNHAIVIDDPEITSYQFTGLPEQDHFFKMTAFNDYITDVWGCRDDNDVLKSYYKCNNAVDPAGSYFNAEYFNAATAGEGWFEWETTTSGWLGNGYDKSVSVPAVPASDTYTESVVSTGTYIDAELYTGTTTGTGTGITTLATTQAGYIGTGYLGATGGHAGSNPPIDQGRQYNLNFTETGTYKVWVRGYALDGQSDTVFIGLNGTYVGVLAFSTYNQWVWRNYAYSGASTINITATGNHILNVWGREDNFGFDGIYLTKGTETPTDQSHGTELQLSSGELSCPTSNGGLNYTVDFTDAGTYKMWIRGYCTGTDDDSVFIGVDDTCVGVIQQTACDEWNWSNTAVSGSSSLIISTTGEHVINVWGAETGHKIDGVYLTTGDETPTDEAHGLTIYPRTVDPCAAEGWTCTEFQNTWHNQSEYSDVISMLECTSFDYSAWSACQGDNTNIRTITTSYATGCYAGTPESLIKSCPYDEGDPSMSLYLEKTTTHTIVPRGFPFRIKYSLTIPTEAITLAVKYDSDNTGYDGAGFSNSMNLIMGTNISFDLDTNIPAGIYYLYGESTSTTGTNRVYMPSNIRISECTPALGKGCAGTLNIGGQ